MIYFFHHYELPVIIQQAQVQQILRLRTRQRHQQQNGNGATSNNASNLRNGSNTIGNQANNSNAMGGGSGGGGSGVAANQMNNNGGGVGVGVGGGNDNNNTGNEHRTGTLFTIISLIMNIQVVSALLNPILATFGAVQGRLINYAFGTAAFSNNNNDNRLNNNNITNNNTRQNNYLSINFTRLRINLSRLRRMNLASGMQINPIEINATADGMPSNGRNESLENANNGDSSGNDAVATESDATISTEVNAAGPSTINSTLVTNDEHHEVNPIENSHPTDYFEFDFIDANDDDDMEISINELNVHTNNIRRTITPPVSCTNTQIQSITNLTEHMHNAPNDSLDRSNQFENQNESMAPNQQQYNIQSINDDDDDDGDDDFDDGVNDLNYQIRASGSYHWKQKQGDNQDNSLSSKKNDICDESAAVKRATKTNFSFSSQASAAIVDPTSSLKTHENRILDKTQSTSSETATVTNELSKNEMKIDSN